jgi:hypothetical protein
MNQTDGGTYRYNPKSLLILKLAKYAGIELAIEFNNTESSRRV